MISKRATVKSIALTVLFFELIGLGVSVKAFAADGPPGTDILLADLSKNKAGFWQLKNVSAVTTRKGYDNQPFFLPDGSGLLYTAILPTSTGLWQADSFEYNFASKTHTNLTNSELSEYSPTLMAKGDTFSAIVVEQLNKQYLWQLPFHSKAKAARLFEIEPVGYHVWGNNGDIAMFVLGEKRTLQYLNNSKMSVKIVASDIGRSLRYVAKRNQFSFSQQKNQDWWLSVYEPTTDQVIALVPMPTGSDYYTWVDDQTAITAVGSSLHLWQYKIGPKALKEDWVFWQDMSQYCPSQISRLAVNHDHSKLALVCKE